MHVDHLPIALLPAHYRCDEHQRVLRHEIPYAAFVFVGVARVCLKVEFEGGGKGEEEEGQEEAEGGAGEDHVGDNRPEILMVRDSSQLRNSAMVVQSMM